jgi:DNA polymerase III gamma/tau subunit
MPPLHSIETLLGQALSDGRFSHAYLLVGEGAASVAQEFVLRLYCKEQCRVCSICSKILHGTHPDLRWIQKEGKRISIDQIRWLQKDARYQPLESSRKVYVLEGAEDLSQEAANSLLKILEAPPEYVIFLLLARSARVLPTLLSRCQILRLTPLSFSQLQETFRRRGFDERETEYLVALTHGFPQRLFRLDEKRERLRPLERKREVLAGLHDRTGPQLVESLAQADGLIEQREAALELLTRLQARRADEILETAQALSKADSQTLEIFLQEALRWYRDVALVNYGEGWIFQRDRLAQLKEHSTHLDREQLLHALDTLEAAREALQGNANVQLFLESLLFTLAGSGTGHSLD